MWNEEVDLEICLISIVVKWLVEVLMVNLFLEIANNESFEDRSSEWVMSEIFSCGERE